MRLVVQHQLSRAAAPLAAAATGAARVARADPAHEQAERGHVVLCHADVEGLSHHCERVLGRVVVLCPQPRRCEHARLHVVRVVLAEARRGAAHARRHLQPVVQAYVGVAEHHLRLGARLLAVRVHRENVALWLPQEEHHAHARVADGGTGAMQRGAQRHLARGEVTRVRAGPAREHPASAHREAAERGALEVRSVEAPVQLLGRATDEEARVLADVIDEARTP